MTKTVGTDEEMRRKDAALPGNHGQFGANNATEEYKPLPDHPDAPVPERAPDEPPRTIPRDSGPR